MKEQRILVEHVTDELIRCITRGEQMPQEFRNVFYDAIFAARKKVVRKLREQAKVSPDSLADLIPSK